MTARPGPADAGALYAGPHDAPDRYRVGAAVGVGGEGQVHHGHVFSEGEPIEVAIKVWNGHEDDPGFARRVRAWQDQRILLQSMSHPNIVRVHDVFVGAPPHPPGRPDSTSRALYLVMDWVPGTPLSTWRIGRHDLTYADVCRILVPVASALNHLHTGRKPHRQAILHRDLKPANVLLDDDGTVTVVDFGLARGADRPRASGGTPGYTAPEVADAGAFSVHSDVFSLGALAYWLVTGANPPERPADHLDDIRSRLAETTMLADAPEIVAHICWALAPQPDDRPDVVTWAAGLRDTTSDSAYAAMAPAAPPRRRPHPPRVRRVDRRRVAAAAVCATLFLAGALAIRRQPGPTTAAEQAGVVSGVDMTAATSATWATTTDTAAVPSSSISPPRPSSGRDLEPTGTGPTGPRKGDDAASGGGNPAPSSPVSPPPSSTPVPTSGPTTTTVRPSTAQRDIALHQRVEFQDVAVTLHHVFEGDPGATLRLQLPSRECFLNLAVDQRKGVPDDGAGEATRWLAVRLLHVDRMSQSARVQVEWPLADAVPGDCVAA